MTKSCTAPWRDDYSLNVQALHSLLAPDGTRLAALRTDVGATVKPLLDDRGVACVDAADATLVALTTTYGDGASLEVQVAREQRQSFGDA